jgi:hypothetical protein
MEYIDALGRVYPLVTALFFGMAALPFVDGRKKMVQPRDRTVEFRDKRCAALHPV